MSERQQPSLFGEIRRMARTSGAVGGIAARVAGQRFLGLRTDKQAHAEDLKAILGGLKGPLMKVAQFLSTVPDALPEEYAQELSAEQIAALWMQVQRESLGPAFEFTEDYGVYWAYIPHFIHSPFYVYAYAFGDCLVNALYGVYRDGTAPDFERKYLDLLRAGGTLRHKELLAPFGLDASDPNFWRRGLDVIAGFIDELEGADRAHG